ncbi:IS5 family transposase [Paraburkholderia tropica]|uniref:IS5 family transposase n=1 Tax=Paraburkholderia tropica TaxID=92647 RepID=UPI003B8A6668
MTRRRIDEALWETLEPLLPKRRHSPKGGRPRVDDSAALNGILFVLLTGIPWEYLPQEMGFGRGMTCWRRLREWQDNGVWVRLHTEMLSRLRGYDAIDWSRVSIDSASVASSRGGQQTGPNPTDRGKLGSKRHIAVDRQGIPLSVVVTGANRHHSKELEAVLDAIPPVAGKRGRPRQRPEKVHADKGYDYLRCWQALKERAITARIARRSIERNDRLGRHRWVVERTHAWLAGFGKLRIRFERSIETHTALLMLACSIIGSRHLERHCR